MIKPVGQCSQMINCAWKRSGKTVSNESTPVRLNSTMRLVYTMISWYTDKTIINRLPEIMKYLFTLRRWSREDFDNMITRGKEIWCLWKCWNIYDKHNFEMYQYLFVYIANKRTINISYSRLLESLLLPHFLICCSSLKQNVSNNKSRTYDQQQHP